MLTWIQIIIAIIVVYVIFEKFRQRRLEGNLPGPPTVPFFGNALLFQGYGIEDFICISIRLQKEFSNLFRLWLGSHLMVLVADPACLETIYKSNDNLNKSILYEFYTDYSRGVVVAGGEKWRGLRKVVNTTFHHSNMENYQKVLNDCSQILCKVLEKRCDGPIFNMDPFIHRCMLDVVCRIIASSEKDIQLKEDVTYPEDVKLAFKLTNSRFGKIWLHSDFIYKLTADGKLKQSVCKKIHEFGLELINERREFLNKIENPTKDDEHSISRLFLDQMMDYAKARNLSDLELSMAITDVIIAGSDTVASAIPYMIMMLALHQGIQDKVYEEIQEIFGDSNRAVEQKDMSEMVVMERVFMEVLRHCCPPHVARRVDKTIILRDVPIPVGSTLLIMLYKLHRDPQHWSHPDAFYPDHFLPENVEKRQKYTFLPFTSGQRACPGKKFSFIVVKTLMTTLLRKYKITTTVHPSEIKHTLGVMLEMSDGCNVQLTPR